MLELNEISNPFPGIRPFETDETNLFFGRDGQSDELLKRMQRTRLLAVVGTSGSGKSSLIRAGLLPALYGGLMGGAGSSWRIAIQRPGGDPIGNLAAALADPGVFGLENNSEIQTTLIETTLRRSSIGLIDVTRQARMGGHENLLVVVDQFEELFRFKQSQTSDDATAFVKLLLEASAQRDIPIYVIITMRSDFLGDCSQFTGLPEAINNGQYLIPRMSRDERQSAIVGPIAVGAGQITQPLVSRLLNDVGDNPDQLPILQHALMRTWDYWSGHRLNGDPIGLEHYTAIGTMSEALSRHADEAFNQLPDERSRLIAEKLFKRLTEKGADNREIRRPTPLAELGAVCGASEAEVSTIIDVFRAEGRSFLMPPLGTKLNSETVIDISHESLIRNWTRLQKWVDEEAQSARIYRRLAEATVLHREGSEGLLQDPGLQIALDWFEKNQPNAAWAARYHPEFDEAKKYLEKSCEAREEAEFERERQRNAELERERREREQAEIYAASQARANRKLRLLMVALGLMLVLAMATAAYAFRARRQAKSSEKEALGLRDEAVKQQKALGTALEIKEQAEKQRMRADLARVSAEKERQVALLDAQEKARIAESEKVKAQREKKRFQDEARRNKKAKEANDAFREAALYVQRGKYQDAKNYFSNAIEGYEDRDVSNPEAVADTSVEMGYLAYSVAHESFLRTADLNRGNAIGNVQKFIAQYENAARIYSTPAVNSIDKAAATHFSLGVRLLDFVDGSVVKPASEVTYAPGWEGAEGELPYLGITPQGLLIDPISSDGSDPVITVKRQAVAALEKSFAEYRQVLADATTSKESASVARVGQAQNGMRKAAYQLGHFHLREANYLDSLHRSSVEYGNAERKQAIQWLRELLSTYSKPGPENARVLIWLGGLHFTRGLEEDNAADAPLAERYFENALAAYGEGASATKADKLSAMGDVLRENNQLWEAAEIYRRAKSQYTADKNTTQAARMAYQIGRIHQQKNRLDEALDDYMVAEKGYQAAFEQDKTATTPDTLLVIGSFYKTLGARVGFDAALRAFDLAIKYGGQFKRDDIQIYQARAYAEKGSVLSLQNKPREALDAYRSALNVYTELASARFGYEGSKETAAAEAERVKVIIKALESGLDSKGPLKQ
jgi:hypothetical protein